MDTYFLKGGSRESSNPLVKHQIDSYNKFVDNTLGQIIAGFNPIKVKVTNPKSDLSINDNNYKISINILQPSITKPSYQMGDGTHNIMTPYIARMNNMSYSSSIYVNVHIVTEYTDKTVVFNHRDAGYTGWEWFVKCVDEIWETRQDFKVYTTLAQIDRPWNERVKLTGRNEYMDFLSKMTFLARCEAVKSIK